jgi:lysyl-tRNA synthetase class 2
MGYITAESFRITAANGGGKLFNDLCGFNKKNKLGLATAAIKAWIDSQAE